MTNSLGVERSFGGGGGYSWYGTTFIPPYLSRADNVQNLSAKKWHTRSGRKALEGTARGTRSCKKLWNCYLRLTSQIYPCLFWLMVPTVPLYIWLANFKLPTYNSLPHLVSWLQVGSQRYSTSTPQSAQQEPAKNHFCLVCTSSNNYPSLILTNLRGNWEPLTVMCLGCTAAIEILVMHLTVQYSA